MPYSLWRNGVLLGELVVELPSGADGIAGVLQPTPAFADVGALTQMQMPGHGAVFQHRTPVKPPEPAQERADSERGRSGRVRANSVERDGVPPELVLELRDADGQVVETGMISISRILAAPRGAREAAISELCRAKGVELPGWCVHASCKPPHTMSSVIDHMMASPGVDGVTVDQQATITAHSAAVRGVAAFLRKWGRAQANGFGSSGARSGAFSDLEFNYEDEDGTTHDLTLRASMQNGHPVIEAIEAAP